MKTIEIFKIRYTDINMSEDIVPMVRGYFANKYKEIEEMHNHHSDKFIYKYPNIQYKVLDKNRTKIAIINGNTLAIHEKQNLFQASESRTQAHRRHFR